MTPIVIVVVAAVIMSRVTLTELTMTMVITVVMIMVVHMMKTTMMIILGLMTLVVKMTRMPVRIARRMRMEHQNAHEENPAFSAGDIALDPNRGALIITYAYTMFWGSLLYL